MKRLFRILPVYASDVGGVCSALYELGGMTVMHDASGCNSTYTTFDEPRWYNRGSMLYGSALVEEDAVLGNDEKLIGDILSAAAALKPRFIAIAGGPVPMMTGTDIPGLAKIVERRSGLPCLGLSAGGMNFYTTGVGAALQAITERFCQTGKKAVNPVPAVNIIGATPLDFACPGEIATLAALFEKHGYLVKSVWATNGGDEKIPSGFHDLCRAGEADVNIVVSLGGLAAARTLQKKLGIPFVAGLPIGQKAAGEFLDLLKQTQSDGKNRCFGDHSRGGAKSSSDAALIINEPIRANAIRRCLELDFGLQNIRVLCPAGSDTALLSPGDIDDGSEETAERAMEKAGLIVADPLYRLVLQNDSARFIETPHQAFSGRIYLENAPNLIGENANKFIKNKLF